MVYKGKLTIGSIIAFLSYSTYVTGPISAIFSIKFIFARILPSARRLITFIEDEEVEKNGNIEMRQDFSCLSIEKVSFSFEEKSILDNVCLKIERGEKIAIVGNNGSGKTTILNLILRFLEPDKGKITINGEDIQKMNLNNYRSLFGVVSQEIHLFQDTYENNIVLQQIGGEGGFKTNYKTTNIFSRFSDQDHKQVDNRGGNFSGGERQRVALDRAILKDAEIMIFDEADNNLDQDVQESFISTVIEDFPEKTIIMVTHDKKYLVGLDKVYRIDKGRLTLENIEDK